MLGRFEDGNRIFASAHHWPKSWYHEAIDQREVEAIINGVRGRYFAVAIGDASEHARLSRVFPLPFAFRFLTGFPPRAFLRLDPVSSDL